MSAEGALAVRNWPVGRYTCELTVQRPKPGAIVNASIEWSPSEPSRLTHDEWREYRHGRNHALAELAAELGINMALVEL